MLNYTAASNDVVTNGGSIPPVTNSTPVALIIETSGSPSILANSNGAALTSITLNSGALEAPSTNSVPTNCNVTVNNGNLTFRSSGVNQINNLLVTGGTVGMVSNSTIAVNSFLMTGGNLAGPGSNSYWADHYVFQATNLVGIGVNLDNLGTLSGYNSSALITTNPSGAPVAPVVFSASMGYTGGTEILGGILQLGSSNNLSTISIKGAITNQGVLNYGYGITATTLTNEVIGSGIVGQVGTGTLTIGTNAGTFSNFTGSFGVANGTLAITDRKSVV